MRKLMLTGLLFLAGLAAVPSPALAQYNPDCQNYGNGWQVYYVYPDWTWESGGWVCTAPSGAVVDPDFPSDSYFWEACAASDCSYFGSVAKGPRAPAVPLRGLVQVPFGTHASRRAAAAAAAAAS
jgi:hypothetical protein